MCIFWGVNIKTIIIFPYAIFSKRKSLKTKPKLFIVTEQQTHHGEAEKSSNKQLLERTQSTHTGCYEERRKFLPSLASLTNFVRELSKKFNIYHFSLAILFIRSIYIKLQQFFKLQ